MKCPNCSYEIENVKARKCPACGARITREVKEHPHEEEHTNDNNKGVTTKPQQEVPMPETEPVGLCCPTCGTRITEETNFCPRCGYQTKPQFDDPPQPTGEEIPPQTTPDTTPLYKQPETAAEEDHHIEENVRKEDLDEYIDNGEYKPYENDPDSDGSNNNDIENNEPQPVGSQPKTDATTSNSWFVIACTAIASLLIGALLYLIV